MPPSNSSANMSSPLCRCRVLYIGSAVPTVTKDGLQGIQQPLRERYPAGESPDAKGIDSWLSVWYNGLLLEYVEGDKQTESAFFPIGSLHYCAAVRYVNMGGFAVERGGGRFVDSSAHRFIPLDSPFALPESPHPPIFAAIFRRTTGVKVLECHGFVCTNEKAANALVRCCFHAYADTMYLKLDEKLPEALPSSGPLKAIKEPSSRSATPSSELNLSEQENNGPMVEGTLDWNERAIGQKTWQRRQQSGEYDAGSVSSSLAKRGPAAHGAGAVVPYGAESGFSRRAASHSELRPPAPHEYMDSPRRVPPSSVPPFFFGPPPHGIPPPFFHGLPPPGPFLRHPPPHHLAAHFPRLPPPPPHFFPPRPAHPAPHFGRIAPPFPPFIMRHPFMMMPPPFPGPHHPQGIRPKSPGSGPIITETVYDTFPRQNRTTYEEPIYMPSSNNPVPPQASYMPGSFSPELYEHYYETYKQQRTAERKRGNVSRSNSDASGDYWEGGIEANGYRKSRANERAFANSLAGEGGKHSARPKVNGGGEGTLTSRPRAADGAGPSGGEPRPETPPADYELGAGANGRRMASY